ncbi:MAG: hypothetical protein GY832_26290 [Chloroflexi bacterium]|nr:hypothetical protein [Chloroflexota bacterium]
MKAGCELDAKIAGLMGWTSATEDCGYGPVKLWLDEHGDCIASQENWGPATDITCVRWSPSEDEGHAGLVLDYLAARGYAPGVFTDLKDRRGDSVACVLVKGPGEVLRTEADTRPLAICLAALEAVERWGEQ